MSRQQFIALLVVALVAISAALYLNTQRNVSREVHGLPLLPALASDLNTVTSLSVLKGSTTPSVTVHKQGEQWTVAERANYPADVSKLRKLLLALSDAKIREEKTSDPANYSIIGVEDPTKPGATSDCRNWGARCWYRRSFIQAALCRIIASGCRTIWDACKSVLRIAWDATWCC